MTNYKLIADAVAADIAAGRLRPGDQLPPQRDFALTHGIAPSTASRVYTELTKRGLTTGEVGRGTFVRMGPVPSVAIAPDPTPGAIDLALNYGFIPEQIDEMHAALASLLPRESLLQAMRSIGVDGTPRMREAAATLLTRGGWTPDPDTILFAGNGRQALAGAMTGLVEPGDRLGVEAMTYPLVKGLAARFGVSLVPIAMDDDGIRPDALERAHRSTPLKGVYLKCDLQNPLGITMRQQRRAELAAVLESTNLYAIEDGAWSFLTDERPMAALAPSRIVHVTCLSKAMPIGYIIAPRALLSSMSSAVRIGAWNASGFGLAIATHYAQGDTPTRIASARRADAAARQRIARNAFSGLVVRGDPRAYHLWLELPEKWRTDAFVAAAARTGISVAPATAFVVGSRGAPNAVRVGLAGPSLEELERALEALRHIAASGASERAT